MFEFLEGEVEAHEPGWLVLRTGGFGWRIAVSTRDAGGCPVGSVTRLRVHLVVGENAFSLYGFADEAGRKLFRRLISVNGVGPGTAMSLLSALRAERLAAAVVDGDVASLTAVKGIGRKTAE
ncbi:MAG TPA: Holliday junction branch migration protein RuvA, partial [Planctomycetota bacterium]